MPATVLEVNDMLGQKWEPLRKFRWIVAIEGIDSWLAKSASRPSLSFGETTIDYINQKRYVAGKGTWAPLTLTLYDPIVPSGAQKVWEWLRLCWENTTGRMGYAEFYYREIGLKMLDPVGAVAQEWAIQNAWVQEANCGDLDYATEEPADITMTIRFNQAILLY